MKAKQTLSTMQQQLAHFIKVNGTKMSTAKDVLRDLDEGQWLRVCEHPTLRMTAYVLSMKSDKVTMSLLHPACHGDSCPVSWSRSVPVGEFNAEWVTARLVARHPSEMGVTESTGCACSVVIEVVDADGVVVATLTIPTNRDYQASQAWVDELTTRVIHSV